MQPNSRLMDALLCAVLVALNACQGVRALPAGSFDADHKARHPTVEDNTLDLSNLTARAPEPRIINIPLRGHSRRGQALGFTMGIKLGTQSKETDMLVDTGSGTFWVVSETSPQKGNWQGLGPASSTTFEDLEITWNAAYGDGSTSVEGTVARDSVTIGSLDSMTGFPIGIGETLKGQVVNPEWSGVAGFTNSKINKPTKTGGVTLIEGLMDWNLIPNRMIGILLQGGTNGADGTGQITLGGSDTSKYKTGAGNLETLSNRDTSGNGFWVVDIADVNVDGKSVLSNRQAILDTGTTQIMVPDGNAELFHNYPGTFKTPDGIFGVPCDPAKIPPMSFKIGSVDFPINPVDIIGVKIGSRGLCYSFIQNSRNARWLLGTPFLKSVYQILDSDADKITLAKLK